VAGRIPAAFARHEIAVAGSSPPWPGPVPGRYPWHHRERHPEDSGVTSLRRAPRRLPPGRGAPVWADGPCRRTTWLTTCTSSA